MYYTIYKITNVVNNKIYIGCHKTEDLNDNYMGSGKVLKRSIEKYGIDSFEKKYLHIFDNPEDMFDMELTLVNSDFIKEATNYNLKVGGEGGWDFINNSGKGRREFNKLARINSVKSQRKLRQNDPEWCDDISKKISIKLNQYYTNGGENGFTGKNHSNLTKKKIGEKNSIHQKGKGNSQYGMMWIYNLDLKESKKIKKNSIIPDGWKQGRKMFK